MTDRVPNLSTSTQKVLRDKFLGKGVLGRRFKNSHATQMAVLSLLPHTDEPAVPEDGDRAELRDGGSTPSAQVTKYLGDSKWQLPEAFECVL